MTRSKEYQKLNSTGSLIEHIPTNTIYSYNTPIYKEFMYNGEIFEVFNDTYYSATTRKHQAKIGHLRSYANLIVHYCPYGEWSLDTALKNEISMTEYELEKLENKTRKLGKRQAEQLENLKTKLQELQKLYAEV